MCQSNEAIGDVACPRVCPPNCTLFRRSYQFLIVLLVYCWEAWCADLWPKDSRESLKGYLFWRPSRLSCSFDAGAKGAVVALPSGNITRRWLLRCGQATGYGGVVPNDGGVRNHSIRAMIVVSQYNVYVKQHLDIHRSESNAKIQLLSILYLCSARFK